MNFKTKIWLFLSFFFVVFIAYLLLPIFFPTSELINFYDFFKFPINFIFFIFSLCFALVLTLLTDFFWNAAKRWKPKIGEAMIAEGLITQEDLKAALLEQSRRLGEILMESGRITPEQRDQALERQKSTNETIGDVLIQLGYADQEDIDRALKQNKRKLGEILKDKKTISDYDLTCILSLKKYRIDSNGEIFIIE
jgi:hypothetical protein